MYIECIMEVTIEFVNLEISAGGGDHESGQED